MIRIDLEIFVEADNMAEAKEMLKGPLEALDDCRYYEQGAVVHYTYSGKQISPVAASSARLERYRQDKEDKSNEED